jgi:ketosteroid isomerase-like protein
VSQENVEVMRRWAAMWNHREWDAFMGLYHADAVVITDPSFMEAGPFRGLDAIRSSYQGLAEPWHAAEVVERELFEAGEGVVLRFDWEVRGGRSGLEMRFDATVVNDIEAGQIVRQQYFFDHVEALKAVGLEE